MLNWINRSFGKMLILSFNFICLVLQFVPRVAGAKFSELKQNSFDNFKTSDSLVFQKECSALINLEGKENISESDFNRGVLLHSLVQQISNSPLEYCDNILMASSYDEIDPEDLPNIK